ncbi:LysR family transcriptional regulator [Pantoea rodasii]|uniref:LysR family transcriptional regulator n=1 Tax=Pantoea rodasii TaxID=1076549 RepID=A0A2M9W4Q3_9GAMM|nr:LysR family transcriptional regulator [Pantoea rodasii]ORM64913.1 LysR family transcriptional regulator [Pantoea rodasii]PJZ02494.1 LysR family transcriptional regulator [Pantoea rodasii]
MLNKSRESRTSTDDLAFFVRVAALESLTAAARELGLSLPAVSKRLSHLEQRLGVQLLKRTTRRLELTAEGKRYLEGARPLLDQLAELEESVSSQAAVLRGTLNINASFGFGRRHVAACVSRFAALHPEVSLSLQLSSQPLNFLDSHIDIDIRIGEPPDARLIARKLRTNPRVLCCAPAYAERCGLPTSIAALAQHNCILLRQYESDFALWRLSNSAQQITQKVQGSLITNDGEVAMQLAMDGHGILLRSWWDAQHMIERGELLHVLPEWSTVDGDIFAVWQPQRQLPARISAFVDFLQSTL